MIHRDTFASFLFVCVLALAGCRQSEPAAPAEIPFDVGPGLSMLAEDGEVSITPGGTPTSEVTLMDDVQVLGEGAVSLTMHSPKGQFITYQISTPAAEVNQYYVEQLPEAGWKVENVDSAGANHTVTATKGNRSLVILTEGGEDLTNVTISHFDDGDARGRLSWPNCQCTSRRSSALRRRRPCRR